MTDPMTPERLTELREAATTATPGPWKIHPHMHGEKGCVCLSCVITTGWRFNHVADCEDTREARDNDTTDCLADAWTYEDATLAAAAPDLLAEVTRLAPMESALADVKASLAMQEKVAETYRLAIGDIGDDRELARGIAVALEQQTAAVEALHQPESGGMGYLPDGGYGTFPGPVCSTCGTPDEYGVPWPCPTRAALDGGK